MVSCVFSLTQTHIHTYKTPIKAATNAHGSPPNALQFNATHIYVVVVYMFTYIYAKTRQEKKNYKMADVCIFVSEP